MRYQFPPHFTQFYFRSSASEENVRVKRETNKYASNYRIIAISWRGIEWVIIYIFQVVKRENKNMNSTLCYRERVAIYRTAFRSTVCTKLLPRNTSYSKIQAKGSCTLAIFLYTASEHILLYVYSSRTGQLADQTSGHANEAHLWVLLHTLRPRVNGLHKSKDIQCSVHGDSNNLRWRY